MEATKYLFITCIVLMVIQYVTCKQGNCYVREYRLLPGGYNIYIQNGVQPVFKAVKLKNISKCGQMCADEKICNVWRFDGETCQIFHASKDNVTAETSANTATKTYYETREDDQWMKIYSVKGGSGINVASTFLADGVHSWIPMNCNFNLCPEFFRSFFIDVWSFLPIMKVKFSLFKNNTEVLRVIFDGQGTNSESWFKLSRVLESPWEDFYNGASTVYFGINFFYLRSFYAAKSQAGCARDSGWIAVNEPKQGCKWASHPTFPDIIYSDKEKATVWATGYGTADFLAIYISF